jgi:putative membrane protein
MHKIPVFKRVWLYLAMMTVYTVVVDIVELNFPVNLFKEASSVGAYGGIVLGILLVFRTNSAYERWWEGRKLWGQLMNDSRNLCLKVRSLVHISDAEKMQFGELVISFAYALKHHLRGTVPSEPLPGVGEIDYTDSKHVPLYITKKIYEKLAEWQIRGAISEINMLIIDQHIRALMDICGACERIKSSPIAVSYRAFMRQGIALNLLAWPWYLTTLFPVQWTLPPMLIGAYFMIGIELIAEDIEEPFGKGGDDLPLDDICSNIKTTVGTILLVEPEQKFTRSMEKPRLDLLKN